MTTYIVVPVHNEEEPLKALLPQIREQYPELHVVVADNGSTDQSATVARQYADEVFDYGGCRGKPQVVKQVFTDLETTTNDRIIIFDGDGQHPVEAIGRLVGMNKEHPGKIIKGTRFCHINGYTVPLERLELCVRSSEFIQEHRGVVFTDPQCGLMLLQARWSQEIVEKLHFDGPSWELELLMYLTSRGRGSVICEMTIPPIYTGLLGEKQRGKYADDLKAVNARKARITEHLAFLKDCLHRW